MENQNSMQTQIEKFNENLVETCNDMNIIQYVKEINNQFYYLEIDFIDDFLDLCNKDGFIINHEMLYKYGVLSENTDSSHVIRLLNQYDLEDGIDYSSRSVASEYSSKDKII